MRALLKYKAFVMLDEEPTQEIKDGLILTLSNTEVITTDLKPYQCEYPLPADLDPLNVVKIEIHDQPRETTIPHQG